MYLERTTERSVTVDSLEVEPVHVGACARLLEEITREEDAAGVNDVLQQPISHALILARLSKHIQQMTKN